MTLATQRGIIITMVNYHDRSSAEDGHFQKKKIKKNTEQLIPPFR
jgi:hypothetical protein